MPDVVLEQLTVLKEQMTSETTKPNEAPANPLPPHLAAMVAGYLGT